MGGLLDVESGTGLAGAGTWKYLHTPISGELGFLETIQGLGILVFKDLQLSRANPAKCKVSHKSSLAKNTRHGEAAAICSPVLSENRQANDGGSSEVA